MSCIRVIHCLLLFSLCLSLYLCLSLSVSVCLCVCLRVPLCEEVKLKNRITENGTGLGADTASQHQLSYAYFGKYKHPTAYTNYKPTTH